MNVPEDTFERIARDIESADSPVGIDAKRTHVLIIHKLEQIERRLDALERMVSAPPGSETPL